MRENKVLHVYYGERLVGTLALTESKKAAFEYADEWLADGFSISPFSLPLEKKVFVPTKDYFRGLFGVFADSLPDAWGQLLLDRMLKKHGINRNEFSIIDRLAVVGNQGWEHLFIALKEICPMVRTWIIWMNWQKNVSAF